MQIANRPVPATTGNAVVLIYRLLASALALGVLVESVFASQGLFNSKPEMIDGHRRLGNLLGVVTVLTLGVAIYCWRKGRFSPAPMIRGTVIVVLIVIQIILGYATRDSTNAIVWHIPTGVALMGLATANAALAWVTPTARRA
ncbi:MAG TPA: hypothetical protein VFQ54_00400 [Thermomicrobiales bacterium]|nr:hypothetical protein [Thermomicrobiales bacterium]